MAPGARGTIVFNHANGFVAGTYRALFDAWRAAGWRVLAHERFGHDPKYPVTSGWPHVRDELLAFIEREARGQPVHLVGHSLGGYLSLLAACRRPDLARSVVMIDSPVVAGWRAHSIQVMKATGLLRRVSPGRVSQTRRQHWPSKEDALRHFGSKSVFRRWDPHVLQDYVEAGTESDDGPDGGVRLAFRRDIETRFYNTLPHHFPTVLRRHAPHCPVGFIGGTQSTELRQVGLEATKRLSKGRFEWIEGTHLFPMEKPKATAQAVLKLLG